MFVTSTEACGPDATCINRPGGLGYDCRCHLGKSGNKCMAGKRRRDTVTSWLGPLLGELNQCFHQGSW